MTEDLEIELTEESLEKAIQDFKEQAKLEMDKQNHPRQLHVRKSSIYLEDLPEIVMALKLLSEQGKNV